MDFNKANWNRFSKQLGDCNRMDRLEFKIYNHFTGIMIGIAEKHNIIPREKKHIGLEPKK